MNIVELKLDETLADFEIQDWIDNVFNKQYPEIEAKIKKGCSGTCENGNRIKELEKENAELKAKLCLMRKWIYGNFDLEDKIAQLKFIDEFGKELSDD